MNRETCETIVFQKLKEIKEIVKQYEGQYDGCAGHSFYFSACISGNLIMANNDYWEDGVAPLKIISSMTGDSARHDN